jgi:phosphoserine phosphatase RsbU/P
MTAEMEQDLITGSVTTIPRHAMQCLEVWSGNRLVENEVTSPGMEAWICSQPYEGQACGGDVHYLSLCVGGIVTRAVLADVSGHGENVADSSHLLKSLFRRHMNSKSQGRLVSDLNREFSELEQRGRFATGVVVTWQNHRRRLLLTNAGHPRPLFYRSQTQQWSFLTSPEACNLPFGIDGSICYEQQELMISEGDRLVLYTDALTEAAGIDGKLLAESGLLELVGQVPPTASPAEFGRLLLQRIRSYAQSSSLSDDTTILVFQFTKTRHRYGVGERLSAWRRLITG